MLQILINLFIALTCQIASVTLLKHETFKTYLGAISDIETIFSEKIRSATWGWMVLRMKNAGSEGITSVREKLLSIWTTSSMVGLSPEFSWTHNKAIWIILVMSPNEPDPVVNVRSIIFDTVPFCQLFHA